MHPHRLLLPRALEFVNIKKHPLLPKQPRPDTLHPRIRINKNPMHRLNPRRIIIQHHNLPPLRPITSQYLSSHSSLHSSSLLSSPFQNTPHPYQSPSSSPTSLSIFPSASTLPSIFIPYTPSCFYHFSMTILFISFNLFQPVFFQSFWSTSLHMRVTIQDYSHLENKNPILILRSLIIDASVPLRRLGPPITQSNSPLYLLSFCPPLSPPPLNLFRRHPQPHPEPNPPIPLRRLAVWPLDMLTSPGLSPTCPRTGSDFL